MNTVRLTALALCAGLGSSACAHEAPRAVASTTPAPLTTPPPITASTSNATELPVMGSQTQCGLSQVFFAEGSAELDAEARADLDAYAVCIDRHELETIYVTGMTDPRGDEEANLALGRTRARAVADYLRERGSSGHFVIRSWGEEGAMEQPQLWPMERNAIVTAVDRGE
jgi:outer membrane protein OmpA-like peptidoglycan-associated protein